jgi:hypothetical protein
VNLTVSSGGVVKSGYQEPVPNAHTEGIVMLRSASLFGQLPERFPRHEFARLVKEHEAKHASKGFLPFTG